MKRHHTQMDLTACFFSSTDPSFTCIASHHCLSAPHIWRARVLVNAVRLRKTCCTSAARPGTSLCTFWQIARELDDFRTREPCFPLMKCAVQRAHIWKVMRNILKHNVTQSVCNSKAPRALPSRCKCRGILRHRVRTLGATLRIS